MQNMTRMGVSPRPASPVDNGAVVLGIDPGTASTGFGLVERRGGTLASLGGGVISTSSDESIRTFAASPDVCDSEFS